MSTENVTVHYKQSEIARLALEIAITQVGQEEVPRGSNKGPMVDKYLKAVGLNPGYAWCQAFVNWCYEQAAKKLGVPEPVPNTGGVQACWRMVEERKKISRNIVVATPSLILPGDQFIMKIGTKGLGHTGIVERIVGGVMHTIEGNTNAAGSREGYAVARKQRKVTMPELLGIIRY